MNKQTQLILTIFTFILTVVSADAQSNLITANSAGKVKLGMTVAQVRKAVAPMKISRTSDGEGVALILVKRGSVNVMTLYAGEEDRDAKINENARIEQIWVLDKTYKTVAGVHPGMLLASAEEKYGKIKAIVMSEIESREFAEFANHPRGIDFRLHGRNGTAGVYASESSRTSSYNPGAYIASINVTGRELPITGGTSGGEVVYASYSTNLKSGCRSSGGEEGGHVSTFCSGPGGYQVHYFDAATIYQLNVADANRDWEVPVTTFGLDKLDAVGEVEWRLANGVPFAVIFAHPGSGKVIARGLKGFERIKFEEEGKGAVERVRSMTDNDYADIVVPATRIYFTGNPATVKGRLAAFNDKLKYVVKANAGDKLTVRIDAVKWTGDEGPVLIVFVTMPDGKGEGEPGGLNVELTQDGDHEIMVRQNAAKSRAENIEFTLTVSLVTNGS